MMAATGRLLLFRSVITPKNRRSEMPRSEISFLAMAAIEAARAKRLAALLDQARREFRQILKLAEDKQLPVTISTEIQQACVAGLTLLEEASEQTE
jgi:hypothetical protein